MINITLLILCFQLGTISSHLLQGVQNATLRFEKMMREKEEQHQVKVGRPIEENLDL